jgi:hypothetical protein
MVNETKDPAVIDRLEKLGFKAASAEVKLLATRKRKMALAYELYRFVRPERINDFNARLKMQTRKQNGGYQVLDFQPIEHYKTVPPADVLNALEIAQDRQCFDRFEIAYIREIEDPILFGRIDGCGDRFYIGAWDKDVSIEDLLKPNEG